MSDWCGKGNNLIIVLHDKNMKRNNSNSNKVGDELGLLMLLPQLCWWHFTWRVEVDFSFHYTIIADKSNDQNRMKWMDKQTQKSILYCCSVWYWFCSCTSAMIVICSLCFCKTLNLELFQTLKEKLYFLERDSVIWKIINHLIENDSHFPIASFSSAIHLVKLIVFDPESVKEWNKLMLGLDSTAFSCLYLRTIP